MTCGARERLHANTEILYNLWVESIEFCTMQAPNVDGWIDPESKTQKPKKNIDFDLHGLWGMGAPPSLQPEVYTASGNPNLLTNSMS